MALPSRSARSPNPSRTTRTARFINRTSWPVVRLAAHDADRAVELFEENKTGETVGQRQSSERPAEVGAFHQRSREPVGATDEERDPLLAGVHRRAQRLRQLVGAELASALVEHPDLGARRQAPLELAVVLHLDH